jgi:hypothetical protein
MTALETMRPASRDFTYVASIASPLPLNRSVEERVDSLVDLCAEPADLALGDPGHAHGLDQFVHGTGRDALHIRFLDHRRERLLGGSARLQERWEVATLTQLRDLHVHGAGADIPEPLAIAVAAILAFGAAFTVGGGADVLDVHVHHALHDVLDHFSQKIGIRPHFQELGQCNARLGHHGSPI